MKWWQNPQLVQAVEKYDQLQEREQKIVLGGIAVLLALLLFIVLIEPVWLNLGTLREQIQTTESTNNSLNQQVTKLENSDFSDPDELLRKELLAVVEQGKKLDEEIARVTQSLVAPKQMVTLLESVLSQDKQLKLISLKNLPERAVQLDMSVTEQQTLAQEIGLPTVQENEPESLIYRHAFEVELEATYDATVNYLQRLDALPWTLFWQQLDYEVKRYPKGTLKVEIYTLSTSREVLGV